jgi:hypothetical protein
VFGADNNIHLPSPDTVHVGGSKRIGIGGGHWVWTKNLARWTWCGSQVRGSACLLGGSEPRLWLLPIRSEPLNLADLQSTDKRKHFLSSRRHCQPLTLEYGKPRVR